MVNLVECRDLRLGYGSNAMSPCPDFTVGAGNYLCIIGPNGSGKTTLLKAIAGLIKPLSGTLALAPELASGGIGYVPQQGPLQRDFPASVREVVQSGCQAMRGWRPFYSRAERQRAKDAMERLGIAALAKRCYRELSGGLLPSPPRDKCRRHDHRDGDARLLRCARIGNSRLDARPRCVIQED